ncbi:MAG: CheY-like chemotaxis protein, partial [Gammaproteobacteria bacterium]
MTVSSEKNKELQQVEPLENARSILLIDDTPAIHDDIRKIFNQLEAASSLSKLDSELFGDSKHAQGIDYKIDSAYQGLEGYRKVRQALDEAMPYSLAIIDMRMPPG